MFQESLPVIVTSEVFHVGRLNEKRADNLHGYSLEGHSLSVSHCPDAWREIAQLGAAPLWKLGKQGAAFLDLLKTLEDSNLCEAIRLWGLSHGLITMETRWRVWQTDEEGSWSYLLTATEGEARAEAEFSDLPSGPNNGPVVEEVILPICTQALSMRTRQSNTSNREAFDLLALVWVEDTQFDIDGIWWREEYSPMNLSAPRAGLLPSRLASWTCEQISPDEVEDDVCESRLKEATIPAMPEPSTPTPPRREHRLR